MVPVAPGPIAPVPSPAPVCENVTTTVSSPNDTNPFLEQILETMRSLKETQEKQGQKIEALMTSQLSSGKDSAEDVLRKILVAAKIC